MRADGATDADSGIDQRIAAQLTALRRGRGWSLDDLAARSGVSRATLSRLEKAKVSATAQTLGKLCAAFGVTLSRLIAETEADFAPSIPHDAQAVWRDPEQGFTRRSVSPPSPHLAAEVVACALAPGACVAYDAPPRPGLEHHLAMTAGALIVEVDGRAHDLSAGDCLRYRLVGRSRFQASPTAGASYFLFLV